MTGQSLLAASGHFPACCDTAGALGTSLRHGFQRNWRIRDQSAPLDGLNQSTTRVGGADTYLTMGPDRWAFLPVLGLAT